MISKKKEIIGIKEKMHFHDRDPVKEADCRLWQSALFFALTYTQWLH